MGLLTDFFAASPEAAAAIDPGRWIDVSKDFEVFESGGLEPTVMLGVLEEVLVGTPFDETLGASIRFGESGECWIYTMRSALQATPSDGRDDWSPVAEAWIATGEVGHATAADMAEFLEELSAFVRVSSGRNLQVYVWGSL